VSKDLHVPYLAAHQETCVTICRLIIVHHGYCLLIYFYNYTSNTKCVRKVFRMAVTEH
jgi:hypothetical protein